MDYIIKRVFFLTTINGFLNFQDLHDFLSDSEPDVSQYQAEVCASFQTVALVNTNPQPNQHQSFSRLQQSSSSPKFLNLQRTASPSAGLKIDDDSSPEELSFRAEDDFLDDDIDEPMQINLPSDNKAVNGNFCDSLGVQSDLVLKSASTECIPEYSAAEESKNVRSFQLITLPDGKTREIDMKVSCGSGNWQGKLEI